MLLGSISLTWFGSTSVFSVKSHCILWWNMSLQLGVAPIFRHQGSLNDFIVIKNSLNNMPWPLQSPDPNPARHLWEIVGQHVIQHAGLLYRSTTIIKTQYNRISCIISNDLNRYSAGSALKFEVIADVHQSSCSSPSCWFSLSPVWIYFSCS